MTYLHCNLYLQILRIIYTFNIGKLDIYIRTKDLAEVGIYKPI